ncbi:MAG TPA: hypothetical protein VH333_10395 [Pseudonocardiaceae bacterium]|jgi:hypothetical protein|nr:hypothetical protein [Pseudonocardiaceae bacterium]
MTTLVIAAVLFAVLVALLYLVSYGLVLLFESWQRNQRRRRALAPITRRLHELLEEAGRPPVVRTGAGRHRLAPARSRSARRNTSRRIGRAGGTARLRYDYDTARFSR